MRLFTPLRRILCLCVALAALGGVLALQVSSTKTVTASSPFGDRAENIDISNAYRLPSVYVEKMRASLENGVVKGSFTAWNNETDIVSNLQYRIEVYGDWPGQTTDDPQVLYAQSATKDLASLVPAERSSVNFNFAVPRLPEGAYSVRVQLVHGRSRLLGWGTQRISISAGSAGFVPVYGATIGLPEFENRAVGALTGPNVDSESPFTLNLVASNPLGSPRSLIPVVRVHSMDTARGVNDERRFDALAVPSGESMVTLNVNAPKAPGVYLATAVLEDSSGHAVSSIGTFRFVVRGMSADIISARLQNVALKAEETAFIHIDHVGPADAQTRGRGIMEVALHDAKGVVAALSVPNIPLTDGVSRGMAKLTLDRDLGSSPTLSVVIRDSAGQQLALSETPIDFSPTQLASTAGRPVWKLWLGWYTQWRELMRFALLTAFLLGTLYFLQRVSRASLSLSGLRPVVSGAVLTVLLLANLQPVFAFGGNNGIEVAAPITVGDNENFISGDRNAYQQYWSEIYSSPVVALFVNQPIHNQTYDCRGPIPFEVRVEYAVCNNIPASGRVIARFDANGNHQTTLMGTNANWVKVFDQIYTHAPACNPAKACILTQNFNSTIFLNSIGPSVTKTTLQVVVKHNAYQDQAHPTPDDTIDPNEIYFQRRFAQAFNLHLQCAPYCGNSVVETGEQCDDGNNINGDGCSNVCAVEGSDVEVVKTGPQTINQGDPITYQITAKNNGPAAAQNVVVTDAVPAGLTFNQAQSSPQCTLQGNVVSCALGTLLYPAQPTVLTLAFQSSAQTQCVPLTNMATITTTSTDSNAGNNSSTVQSVVNCPNADMSIEKTSSSPTVVRGNDVTFTLTVKNNGQGTATNIVVRDTLQGGLQFISVSDPACTFNAGTNEIRCQYSSMSPGETKTINIVAKTPVITGCTQNEQVYNTGFVQSDTTDPNPQNNQSQITITLTCPVVSSADLRIVKTADPTTLVRGANVTYTLVVTNAGPSPAQNVVVRDAIQGGLQFISVSDPACTFNAGTNEIRCQYLNMAPNETKTIQIVLKTPVLTTCTQNEQIYNTAFASSDTPDPDSSNNQSQITITLTCPVTGTADVSVEKTGPASAVRGGTLTYTLLARNLGPAIAQNVIIRDPIPGGLTYVSATGATCSLTNNNTEVSCTLGDMPANTDKTVTLTFSVPQVPHCLIGAHAYNTAYIYTDTPDPVQANNLSQVVTPITCPTHTTVDLSIVKTGSSSVVNGGLITYTLTATNNGTVNVDDVEIYDNFPPELTYVSASDPTCRLTPNVTRQVWCGDGFDIPAGQSKTVYITFRVAAPTNPCAPFSFQNEGHTFSPENTDPNSTNNSSTVTTNGTCPAVNSADLRILKTADPTTLARGGNVTYTLVVTNAGPSPAQNVVVRDAIQGGLTFVSVSDTACGFNPNTNEVRCQYATLNPNETKTIRITLTTPTLAQCPGNALVYNTGFVSSDTPDPDSSNNQSQITITLTCPVQTLADVSVTKAGPATAQRGSGAIAYVVTVTNNGPGSASGVTLQDIVPTGLSYVSATGASCTPAGSTVQCAVGNLAPGVSLPITLVFTAPLPSQCAVATVQNTVTVASATSDPNLANNTAFVSTTLTCPQTNQADLSVIKTGLSSTTRGGTLSYTLFVVNNGPAAATNFTVTDTFPLGLTYVSASESNCVLALPSGNFGGFVSCPVASLAAGATKTIVLNFSVPLVTGCVTTTVQNTGSVLSTTPPDPVSTNNQSVVSTTLQCPVTGTPDLAIAKTGPASVVQGSTGATIVYTITVTNAGTATATGVTVRDVIPSGLNFSGANGATCATTATEVFCSVGDLAVSSAPKTFTMTFIVPAQTTCANRSVVNTATVTGNPQDSNTSNNSSSVTTAITCQQQNNADLLIVKTGLASVTRGGSIAYNLFVSNNGPAAAANVVVKDAIPSGLTYQSASGATCTTVSNEIQCQLGSLAAGASQTISLNFLVPTITSCTQTTVQNTGRVESTSTDPNTANNQSTVSTILLCQTGGTADVSITKSGPSTVQAGSTFTYTLTVNNAGPGQAENVTVYDSFAGTMTYQSSSGVSCSPSGSQVQCPFGTLNAGETRTVTLTFQSNQASDAYCSNTYLSNIAAVTTTSSDANSANNQSQTISTAVQCSGYIPPNNCGTQPCCTQQPCTTYNQPCYQAPCNNYQPPYIPPYVPPYNQPPVYQPPFTGVITTMPQTGNDNDLFTPVDDVQKFLSTPVARAAESGASGVLVMMSLITLIGAGSAVALRFGKFLL